MDFYSTSPKSSQQSFFIALILTCACVLMAWIGPKWLSLLEPDSGGYIDFIPMRSAFYPLYLHFMSALGFSLEQIPNTHLVIYALSLIFLFYILMQQHFPVWLVVTLACAVMFNIYYNAYHFTILTESLTFSLQNVLLALTLVYVRAKKIGVLLAIGCTVGFLCGMKPALFAFVPAIVFIVIFAHWGQGKSMLMHVLAVTLAISSITTLETTIHSASHTERKSLAPIILYGKAAILMTDPQFKAPQFTNAEEQKTFDLTQEAMQPIKQWLAQQTNPFLLATYLADYEVFAQFSLWPQIQKTHPHASLDDSLRASIGKAVILNNMGLYFKLSLMHYLGLWTVHGKHFFADIFTQTETFPYMPNGWENGFDDSQVPLSFAVFPAFLLLGGLIITLTFIAFGFIILRCRTWASSCFKPYTLQMISLLLFVQAHLVATALANISTIRYTIVVYPHAVLISLMVFNILLYVLAARDKTPQMSWSSSAL